MNASEPPTFIRLPDQELPRPGYVKEGERVVWHGKPVLRAVASNIGGAIFFLALALGFGSFGALQTGGGVGVVVVLGVLILLFMVVLPMIALSRMEYVITDGGVYTRRGVIGERVNQTTFEKITDISYNQDIWGRILRYGTLNVNTAGSNQNALTMIGLPDALGVKRFLEQAKAEQFGERAADEDLPFFVPKEHVVQILCDACGQRSKRPRNALGSKGPCNHCGKTIQYKEAPPDAGPR